MTTDIASDIVLPPQYGQALQLAETMLGAARDGDWDFFNCPRDMP